MVFARREGDWDCPRCGNLVFAKNSECPKCGYNAAKNKKRPGKKQRDAWKQREQRDAWKQPSRRPGDWTCPNCAALNFSYRSECFKCNEPRPADVEASGEEPEEGDIEEDVAEVPEEEQEEVWEEPVDEQPEMQDPDAEEEANDMDEPAEEDEEASAQLPDASEEPGERGEEHGPRKRRRKYDKPPPWAGPERQPNDWDCAECGAVNFARRESCSPTRNGVDRREGDWDCPRCGVLNFSWRTSCLKCGYHKGGEEEEAVGVQTEVDGSVAPNSPPMNPATPAAPAQLPQGEAMKTLFRLSPKFRASWMEHTRRKGIEGDPSACERSALVEFLDLAAGQLQAPAAKPGAPRPSAKPGSSSCGPRTLSIKRTIVDRINELNSSGKLKQAIRLPSVAVSISGLPEEKVLEVLASLEDLADEVENPADFVKAETESMKELEA
ncbi:Zinc finger Ran-binding domain-containing protein 2 [Symbiodinium microadriaticum]|uniref:Zinc finger Ran-binding domain-containing protein 2 n=1 Tax=Symbiodinium microadriaticum TaxID=2951 RepID=A0A1Q9F4Q6_SYMMI|nr:Zinc finger Ran-binding domain-containing protein 2 [Symbiodinium microadriaticum]